MFSVINKETNALETVYSVKEDSNGITRFLFYREGKWVWEESKLFKPFTNLFEYTNFFNSKGDDL